MSKTREVSEDHAEDIRREYDEAKERLSHWEANMNSKRGAEKDAARLQLLIAYQYWVTITEICKEYNVTTEN